MLLQLSKWSGYLDRAQMLDHQFEGRALMPPESPRKARQSVNREFVIMHAGGHLVESANFV